MPDAVSPTLEPPAELDAVARREWVELLPLLCGMRVMTVADVPALVDLCKAASEEAHSIAMLNEEGWVTVSKNGHQQRSPWVGIRNDAYARKASLMQRFGLTPADRTKVQTVAAPKKANKFA
jgi:P27 family predicted phage terminase small subunit